MSGKRSSTSASAWGKLVILASEVEDSSTAIVTARYGSASLNLPGCGHPKSSNGRQVVTALDIQS